MVEDDTSHDDKVNETNPNQDSTNETPTSSKDGHRKRSFIKKDVSRDQRILIDRLKLEAVKLSQTYQHVTGLLGNRMALIHQLSEPILDLYDQTISLKKDEWLEAKAYHDQLMAQSVELNEKLSVLPELHAAVKKLRKAVDICDEQLEGS